MTQRPGPFEVSRRELSETLSVSKLSQAGAVNTIVTHPITCLPQEEKIVPLFPQKRGRLGRRRQSEEHVHDGAPERSYDCQHYDLCLSLAAALDWDSFHCNGCNGCVNEKLMWRAHHVVRTNSALRKICDLPELK